jgi:hypothetical protein
VANAELRTERADSLLTASDHASAAAVLTEADLAVTGTPEFLLGGARALARCIGLAERDEKLNAPQREAAARHYSQQSLALLRAALTSGGPAPSTLAADPTLVPLLERPGVRQQVLELDASR